MEIHKVSELDASWTLKNTRDDGARHYFKVVGGVGVHLIELGASGYYFARWLITTADGQVIIADGEAATLQLAARIADAAARLYSDGTSSDGTSSDGTSSDGTSSDGTSKEVAPSADSKGRARLSC